MSVLDSLFPQTRGKVTAWLQRCTAAGLDVRPYSGFRSFAEQKALHDAFVAGTGPKAAVPGHSYHNVRRAVDFFCYRGGAQVEDGGDPLYRRAGELAEACGLVWGGRWQNPDWDHVEDEFCAADQQSAGPTGATHFAENGECQA